MTIHTTILLFLVAFAMPAFTEGLLGDPEEIKALRTYCKADVERLCPNV